MKKAKTILVLGANGLAGTLLVSEALNKGYQVKAGIRNVKRKDLKVDARAQLIEVDATDYDSVKKAVLGCDIVINATRAPYDTDPEYLVQMNKIIIRALESGGVKRLIIIGGAGSLQTMDGEPFVENDGFPEDLYKLGLAQYHLRKFYEGEQPPVDWLYLIPPPNFIEKGERTGEFQFLKTELKAPESSLYKISYADYAVALIHEVGEYSYSRQSLLVVGG